MNSFRYFRSFDNVNYRTVGNGLYEFKDAGTNQWNQVKDCKIGRMLAKDGYQISRIEAEKNCTIYQDLANPTTHDLVIWKPKSVQLMCIIRPEPFILLIFVLISHYKRPFQI
jgi:hypothetical protein